LTGLRLEDANVVTENGKTVAARSQPLTGERAAYTLATT
jgi:hypothetical protein